MILRLLELGIRSAEVVSELINVRNENQRLRAEIEVLRRQLDKEHSEEEAHDRADLEAEIQRDLARKPS